MRDTTISTDTSTIFRMTDGGATSTSVATGLAGLRSLIALTPRRAFAAGDRGAMYRTEDSGTTWQKVRLPTMQSINAIRFVNDSLGFAIGDSGVVLQTQS